MGQTSGVKCDTPDGGLEGTDGRFRYSEGGQSAGDVAFRNERPRFPYYPPGSNLSNYRLVVPASHSLGPSTRHSIDLPPGTCRVAHTNDARIHWLHAISGVFQYA